MKNLQHYLNQIESGEKFSGFDGNEYNMQFGGGEYNMGADGSGSCVRATRPAKPYSITYFNTYGGAGATFVAFGKFRYGDNATYGCTLGVTITCGGGITYEEMINQSINPFYCQHHRVICTTAADLAQTVTLTRRDANGRQVVDPINWSEFRDMYANATDVVDVAYPIMIDGNTYITGTLAASSTLTIIFYPEIIVNTNQLIAGDTAAQAFEQPILSKAVPVTPRLPVTSFVAGQATKGRNLR